MGRNAKKNRQIVKYRANIIFTSNKLLEETIVCIGNGNLSGD